MWRAERFGRLGLCLVLAGLVALVGYGCANPTEEEYTQLGLKLMVTSDTATVFHREPSLNPDGVTVIFSTDWPFNPAIDEDKTARDIAVIDIPPDLKRYPITGAPDTIAAAHFRKVEFGILQSDLPGGGSQQFDPNLTGKGQPVWNPTNGNQFAVVIQNANNLDRIFICDVDLTQDESVPVTSARMIGNPDGAEYFFGDPAFSRDGRWLMFSRFFFRAGNPNADPPIPHQTEPQALYVLDLTDDSIHQLTSGSSQEGDGAWSPDGRHIVFASNRMMSTGAGRDLFMIDFDPDNPGAVLDLNLRRLTYSNNDGEGPSYLPEESFGPTWAPNGASIVFTSTRRNTAVSLRDRSIWIMDPDGSNQRELVFTRQDDINPCFDLNSSGRIVYSSADHPLESFNGQRSDIWLLYDFQ